MAGPDSAPPRPAIPAPKKKRRPGHKRSSKTRKPFMTDHPVAKPVLKGK